VNLSKTGLRTSSPDGPKAAPESSDKATGPKRRSQTAPTPRQRRRRVAVATRPTARHRSPRRRCRCSTPSHPVRPARRYLDDRRRSLSPWPPAIPSRCQSKRRRRGLLVGLGSSLGVGGGGSPSSVGSPVRSRRLGVRLPPSALVRPVRGFVAARFLAPSSRARRPAARGSARRVALEGEGVTDLHLGVPAWSPRGPLLAPESWDTATQSTASRSEVGR
jgi:hypothetical protein